MMRVLGAPALALMLALALASGAAHAHKPSDSHLRLAVDGADVAGQWDIALRDLDMAIGLDRDQDGVLTWGEVKARHADIAHYALARLAVGAPGAPCRLVAGEQLVDDHTDGAYAVLRFTATCAEVPRELAVDYRLFAEIDPQHRGLVRVEGLGGTRAGILGVGAAAQTFDLAAPSRLGQFVDYLREGIVHIWIGVDHILFLLSLLLPAVLVRAPPPAHGWAAAPDLRAVAWDVCKIVTAFTVAHSITLTLAALGVVTLPSRLVESAIAVSVVAAALNNVHPLVYGARWAFAFVFGLVHGFGFAGVLADLGLPQDGLVLSLVAFNLGVELGQLAIVAAFLPLAFALRGTRFYQRGVVVGGSLAVAVLALAWAYERAFDVTLVAGLGL